MRYDADLAYTQRYEAREIAGIWWVVQVPAKPSEDEILVCAAISYAAASQQATAMTARRLAA